MQCERPVTRRRARNDLGVAAAAAILLVSCASPRVGGPRPTVDDVGNTAIRVLIAPNLAAADLSATGSWTLLDDQRRLLARASGGDAWRIERNGTRVRAVGAGTRTGWVDGPIYAVIASNAFGRFGGRRYRGELMARSTA